MSALLDAQTLAELQRYGFDESSFDALRARLGRPEAEASNHVAGKIEPPTPDELRVLPPVGSEARRALEAKGEAALARGSVAAVVLAGGMATRFGGVVKAGVDAVRARTFLDLKLSDVALAAKRCSGTIPVALMTSFATHDEVEALAAPFDSKSTPVSCFPQYVSLRLTPDGEIFPGEDGKASRYAPGHGDLTFALRRDGLLSKLRKQGVETLFMSNVDNLGATLDPAVIGAHLEFGAKLTAEVVRKEPGDKGGAPARVDGVPQIVEAFRFPDDFDQDRIPVFNTNSIVMDAAAIDRDFELTFFLVRKKVDGRDAVQFERLVGELTAFLPTRFLEVGRGGPDGRFQPVKDPDELDRRRADIEALLSARGVL